MEKLAQIQKDWIWDWDETIKTCVLWRVEAPGEHLGFGDEFKNSTDCWRLDQEVCNFEPEEEFKEFVWGWKGFEFSGTKNTWRRTADWQLKLPNFCCSIATSAQTTLFNQSYAFSLSPYFFMTKALFNYSSLHFFVPIIPVYSKRHVLESWVSREILFVLLILKIRQKEKDLIIC